MTTTETEQMYRDIEAHAKAAWDYVEEYLKKALGGMQLTDAQRRMTQHAVLAAYKCSFLTKDSKSEVKSFQATLDERGDLRVVVEVGMVGDEGTMAACLCRYHRQFWVSRRGGLVTYLSTKRGLKHRRHEGRAALRHIGSLTAE